MSFSTLGIGASALSAAQRSVETAAHNVANSTVEGYTRQRVSLAASTPSAGFSGVAGGMRGTGVTIVALDRLRNDLQDIAVRAESSSAGTAGARAQVLDRAQGVLGPYGNGLPESLGQLWKSFDQLALTPSSPAARQLTLDAAATVADGVRDAAGQLARIRTDTLAAMQGTVTEVNAAASEVAGLNLQIADALVGRQVPADLMDRRDLALDRLASLTGATVRVRSDGMVDVSLGGETLVRGDRSTALVLTSTTAGPGTAGGDPMLTLDGRPARVGGTLAGSAGALVTDLRQFEAELDGIANALATAVNDQHARGFDAAGGAGRPVFVGSSARDFALADLRTSDLAASGTAVPGGSPYDGENALLLARLRQPGADGTSLSDRLHGLAATLGSRAASALRAGDAAEAGLDGVRQQRAAAIGVSVDEEMIDLVKFQHAYDAAARVISIADGMLDTIVNRMGAGR